MHKLRLVRLDSPGSGLSVGGKGLARSEHIRVRILAREMGIAPGRIGATTDRNTRPAQVIVLGDDSHPGLARCGSWSAACLYPRLGSRRRGLGTDQSRKQWP